MQKPIAFRRVILPALLLLAACGQDRPDAAGSADEAGARSGAPAGMARSPSPPGAGVFFIMPADGDVVSSPVRMEFGITGMEVLPAGSDRPNSGHHHLIIDSDLPDLRRPIPADDRHVHFGDGSSTAELTMSPGRHTLQLLFADYLHVPHDPPVISEPITITVE